MNNLSSTFLKPRSLLCGFGGFFFCVGSIPRRKKVLDLLLIISVIVSIMIVAPNAFAVENSAGSSAALLKPIKENPDNRVIILREFLGKFNSPLAPFAVNFIETADKYDLDWKLVAAISGVESTFGHQIPYASFNGWGWGIYGNNVIRFSSWKEGIETVSKGLRENYIDRGTKNVYEIGRFYAASPTWAQRVSYFMRKIDEFKDQKLVQSLSISL